MAYNPLISLGSIGLVQTIAKTEGGREDCHYAITSGVAAASSTSGARGVPNQA
jgi:hypothetical protein